MLDALPAKPDADAKELLAEVAKLVGATGALLLAAGDKFGSDRLLLRAAELAPQGTLREAVGGPARPPCLLPAEPRALARVAPPRATREGAAAGGGERDTGADSQASGARAPLDQELVAALARARKRQGDASGCLSLLAALGPPGHLTGDAQQLLGACAADTGDLERSATVLQPLLDERLPAFVRARREYFSAADAAESRLGDQADRGALPADVQTAIDAAPQASKSEVYQKWVDATLSKDPRLGELRAAYLEAAERAFLAVREEAEGGSGFHLGLGQVYYRLGKVEKGAKELQGLLDRNDPDLTLAVASAYRELGLDRRAREIAEADRSFAQAVEIYDRRAAHESSAANNAAVALMGRYSATGDLAHLRGAVATCRRTKQRVLNRRRRRAKRALWTAASPSPGFAPSSRGPASGAPVRVSV